MSGAGRLHVGPASHVVREPRRRGAGQLDYATLVATASAQLTAQLPSAPTAPVTLVVVPVVGFGGQSRLVLDRTLSLLAAPAPPAIRSYGRQIVLVVNRPVHQRDDGTAGAVRRWVAQHHGQPGAASLAWCELTLQRRPRIGELRQVAVDAVAAVWGPLPVGSVVVPADDDIVAWPSSTLAGIEGCLSGGAGRSGPVGLAVGPVLFDDPTARTCLFVELFVADLVRALLSDRLLGALAGTVPGPPPAAEVFDSLILSGHLGVRIEALHAAGGFGDLNELTELLRGGRSDQQVGRPLAVADHPDDPVAALLDGAVRVSSRRALAAWSSGNQPTVAQWKAHRLRAAKVDPVRVQAPPPSPAPLGAPGRKNVDVDVLEAALATVFDYLAAPPDAARWAVGCLGLGPRDVVLRPPGGGVGWQVRIQRTAHLVERVAVLQRSELDRHDDMETLLRVASTAR